MTNKILANPIGCSICVGKLVLLKDRIVRPWCRPAFQAPEEDGLPLSGKPPVGLKNNCWLQWLKKGEILG